MKTNTKAAIATLTAVGAIAFLIGRDRATLDPLRPTPGPPILEKVQALGELHTARYTYQNVFEHATARRAAEWASYVPGASSLVRATTRNSALVEVSAEVEAGVDLAKARLESSTGKPPHLILPHARVYRPQVDAKVHDVRRGFFWKDDNIALDAISDAQVRLRQAALQQGIIATAEKNALDQVHKLVDSGMIVSFE